MYSLDKNGNPKMVSKQNPAYVENLSMPSTPRQLAAGATSANVALTVGCKRASIYANGASMRFLVGSSAQTALATSHFISDGERLDLSLPDTPNIAVIRNATTSGVLEISELI